MPSTAPPFEAQLSTCLRAVGERIRSYRKGLRISTAAAAQAAGMSRATLHRIERGEPSVTMGAYVSAAAALGLQIGVSSAHDGRVASGKPGLAGDFALPDMVRLADYPQLRRLAWHLRGAADVTPAEALQLYERNWRHLDQQSMPVHERDLIQALLGALRGGGRLLV